ncbi:MAG: hypothetical protein ABR928_00025 [Terracidiphilus sp.]|jgi:hypothetical protein
MLLIPQIRRALPACLGLSLGFALLAVPAFGQSSDPADNHGKPLPMKPDLPGMARNHRLILKDGTYQVVREYKVVGNRVRYLSQERGDWEEMPLELVDWDATKKWEQEHTDLTANDGSSPAMKEAESIDKEEAEERDDQKARMPEVATGLELPDEDGVFVLDTFQGTPELVELPASDLDLNARERHGIAVLNPMGGKRADMELQGAHSKIHLHVNQPSFFLSLDVPDAKEPVLSEPVTVHTSSEGLNHKAKQGAHSAQSGFALVKVDERNAIRVIGAIKISPSGQVTQSENVVAANMQVMPGKHWLRIDPKEPLDIGEYALVEILSAEDINQQVWDFRVDPTKGDNPGSITPIQKEGR